MMIIQYVLAMVIYVQKKNFVKLIICMEIAVLIVLIMDVQIALLLVVIWGVILASRDTISIIKVPAQVASVKCGAANPVI